MNNYPWNQVNPYLDVIDTRKKFFNKFCYAIVYKCLGSNIIRLATNLVDIDVYIDRRISGDQMLKKHSMWSRAGYITSPGDINKQQITALFNIKHNKPMGTYLRVEEPFVRIYGQTEQLLYNIASNELAAWKLNLCELHRPSNVAAELLLNSGNIVMKTNNGYRYKFVLRDGYYGEENKLALSNYLIQLGDIVKVSPTVKNNLMSKGRHLWRGWFYSNEYDIKTMIDLIAPGAVSNIHEVTSIE